MDRKFELGQKVICSAYVKKTKNHYETSEDRDDCDFWADGSDEGVAVEDFHICDKFVRVPKPFKGVYVGTTVLTTKILAEYDEPPYGRPGFYFSSEEPRPFVVVYYADNRKRLVPMDAIWSLKEMAMIEGGELDGGE